MIEKIVIKWGILLPSESEKWEASPLTRNILCTSINILICLNIKLLGKPFWIKKECKKSNSECISCICISWLSCIYVVGVLKKSSKNKKYYCPKNVEEVGSFAYHPEHPVYTKLYYFLPTETEYFHIKYANIIII